MAEPLSLEEAAFEPTRLPARALPTTVLTSIAMRFGAIGLNAVCGILTARALLPEGRGQLAAMIIWPALLAWVTTFGLPSAIVYHLRRDDNDASVLVGWGLLLCLAGAMLGTVAGWYVIPVWLQKQPDTVILAAQLCLMTTWLSSLTLLGRAAWEAKGQFGRSNVSQMLTPLVVAIGLCVLMARGVLTPYSAAAVYALAGVPTLVWMMVSVARAFHPTLRGGRHVSRRLVDYGFRSYGVDLCGALAVYLDQALVVGLLSAASMGIYVVALSVSRMLYAVHSAVASIVFPKVVGLEPGDIARAVARSARMAMIASGAIGLLIIAAGPTLLRWLYGPSFGSAATILPILVCEVMSSGAAYVLQQSFLAAGRPGVATLLQIGSVTISIPIFLVLVPAFGIVGAASALLAGSLIRLLFTMVAYWWVLGVSMPRLWIDGGDIADLSAYRGLLVASLGRLRAAGEVK